jgi:hypothetical protein
LAINRQLVVNVGFGAQSTIEDPKACAGHQHARIESLEEEMYESRSRTRRE